MPDTKSKNVENIKDRTETKTAPAGQVNPKTNHQVIKEEGISINNQQKNSNPLKIGDKKRPKLQIKKIISI